jgi:hypothetical protein
VTNDEKRSACTAACTPRESNTTAGNDSGTSDRRASSQNTSRAPLSAIRARGKRKLTGTAINPARMMPSTLAT